MDRMIDRSAKVESPGGLLLFGLLMLLLAVYGTFTGKLYGRGSSVDRAQSPFEYWIGLVVQYAFGLFCLWAAVQ